MFTAILLSAGSSMRFGSPKALAEWKQHTVIEQIQQTLLTAGIEQIIIVLGAYCSEIIPYILKHKSIEFVYNKDYKFGQTSSFKSGLTEMDINSEGIILLPVDYPAVKACTIRELIDVFNDKRPDILIPCFNDRKGHPPVFSAGLKEKFLSLDNNDGINSVFHEYKGSTIIFPVKDPGVVATFNTQEEFDKLGQNNVIINHSQNIETDF